MDKKISLISLFPICIYMMHKGKEIGQGTGFIYFHKETKSHFVITNYHVATARLPKEPNKLLPGYPDSPDTLEWIVINKNKREWHRGGINIFEHDQFNWIEHPKRENGVDIIAIKIKPPGNGYIVSQDMLSLVDDINLEVAGELFIVGYPYGIAVNDIFPIWKRGTIASEPLIEPNNLPQFYIDATTHPGMSGSPVFAVETRQLFNLGKDEHEAFQNHASGKISALDTLEQIDISHLNQGHYKKHYQLIGIYSGRLCSGQKDSNLGIVWNYRLIEELFSIGVSTKHPYPPF